MQKMAGKIDELSINEFDDTIEQFGVYGSINVIPEATPANMIVLVEKINELIKIINKQ
ncbi:hypothetical protein [Tenacibaculum caenipelagi]|nr:hypothetical protein [Tenacibaculum caenipelagi]